VRSYRLALQNGQSGEAYNFGSGRGVSVRELFEIVRRISQVEAQLGIQSSRIRPTDIPYFVADIGKACRELGWEAVISLGCTVQEMFETLRGYISIDSRI